MFCGHFEFGYDITQELLDLVASLAFAVSFTPDVLSLVIGDCIEILKGALEGHVLRLD